MGNYYSLAIVFTLVIVLAIATLFGPFAKPEYNVVIFAFDGLQARHLSAYGYHLDTTPNLNTFLADSYTFTNAVSPASWTVPSFMSIFTSLHPSEHRLTNKLVEVKTATSTSVVTSNLQTLSPTVVTLAQIMKKHGYQTAGFTGDAGVSAAFGYDVGFDTYYDKQAFGGLTISKPLAVEWLKANKDQKFFMFLHGYDVHGQHTPADGFDYRYVQKPYIGQYSGSAKEQGALREQGLSDGTLRMNTQDQMFWRSIYDEKINDADKAFGDFMQELESLGIRDKTIIIVLSDHGTEFFEHGRVDHGHTLYGELLDVLFAVHVPEQKGKEVSDLVSTIDLVPTLLSLLNIKDAEMRSQARGVDLTPSFSGQSVAHDVYSETDYRLYTHKRSITTVDGWKFILTREDGSKELYNLITDPNETTDVLAQEPMKGYELEQKLLKHLKEIGDTGPWRLGCLAVYADQCN